MKTYLSRNWLGLLAVAMAFVAIALSFSASFAMPFAYYQLMNWVIAGSAIMIAWRAYRRQNSFVQWLFILFAVVFNPVALMYLNDLTWLIADGVVAIAILSASIFIKE